MSELLNAARKFEAEMIEDRRTIHRNPEVGFDRGKVLRRRHR